MAAAERDGCKSHGLFRLKGWCASVASGKISKADMPAVHDVAPSVVKVDARRSVAPLALRVGLPVLAEKARAQGIAVLVVCTMSALISRCPMLVGAPYCRCTAFLPPHI